MTSSPLFSVTVLGSGTCTPLPNRGFPGYLLRHGTRAYLVDSGSGTIERLLKAGVPPVELEALFYTHIHLDHVGDLFPLLFTLTNSWGDARREKALTVTGPVGFTEFFQRASAVFPSTIDNSRFPVRARELGADVTRAELPDGLTVEAVQLAHAVPSVGYRFTTPDGRVICYTGDTDVCPGLETLLHGADIAVAECSTPDELKIPGHLSPTPLGIACQKAGVQRLVLTHLYPPANESNLLPDIRHVFDGQVDLAEDGKTYAL